MSTVNPIPATPTTTPLPPASADEVAAAQTYEDIFVPALFRCWTGPVIRAAGVAPGERTLDIACGTGVLTRALAASVGPGPAPVGLDIAPGMLAVAQRITPGLDWRHGDASALPFEDAAFDRVLCQYGLMFFPDRCLALREMSRVLAPGGRLAVAVWDTLDANPGFSEKVEILDEVGGVPAGDALRAPFCLGDRQGLRSIADAAGLDDIEIETLDAEAAFRSLAEFVEVEVRGWLPVMGVHLSEDDIARVHALCRERLAHYVGVDGALALPVSAHILSAGRAAAS